MGISNRKVMAMTSNKGTDKIEEKVVMIIMDLNTGMATVKTQKMEAMVTTEFNKETDVTRIVVMVNSKGMRIKDLKVIGIKEVTIKLVMEGLETSEVKNVGPGIIVEVTMVEHAKVSVAEDPFITGVVQIDNVEDLVISGISVEIMDVKEVDPVMENAITNSKDQSLFQL